MQHLGQGTEQQATGVRRERESTTEQVEIRRTQRVALDVDRAHGIQQRRHGRLAWTAIVDAMPRATREHDQIARLHRHVDAARQLHLRLAGEHEMERRLAGQGIVMVDAEAARQVTADVQRAPHAGQFEDSG